MHRQEEAFFSKKNFPISKKKLFEIDPFFEIFEIQRNFLFEISQKKSDELSKDTPE